MEKTTTNEIEAIENLEQELGSNNKAEKSWDGEMIKNICIPVKVDRLGRIIEVKYRVNE